MKFITELGEVVEVDLRGIPIWKVVGQAFSLSL